METLLMYLAIAFRSMLVFLLLTLILRFFGQKETGEMSAHDLILIVLMAEAVGHSMIGDDVTLPGGLIAFITIFLTNKALNRLMYRYPKLADKLESSPLVVIQRGEFVRKNMKKLALTEAELKQLLREEGRMTPQGIRYGIIESDGSFSVIEE